MTGYIASWLEDTGSHGEDPQPRTLAVSKDGTDIASAQLPAWPARFDEDEVIAELGYRRVEGERWYHAGFASSVKVEPIPRSSDG